MLREHSMVQDPPPTAPPSMTPTLADAAPDRMPLTAHAYAVRLALGDRIDVRAREVLARAIVDIVPLRNDMRVAGAYRGADHLHLMINGWALRATDLPDGSRQITDILLPGDICDWDPPTQHEEIRACGPALVAILRRPADMSAAEDYNRARDSALITEVLRLRAAVTSLGRRSARERVAYLLSDLYDRLARIGLAKNNFFACPLTQEHLADLLGLTSVHINRVIQGLRRESLLSFSKRQIGIADLKRLHALAGWSGGQSVI